MQNILKLIRVNQWIKNTFIFLPIFFSGQLLNNTLLIKSCIAFISFCFIASSVYIINDYIDIDSDKKHPEKKNRPLANGSIKKRQAIYLFFLLFLLSYFFSYLINSIATYIIITFYFLINLAYSLKLKHIAIIDLLIIALGFLLRVYMGGYSTNLPVSFWAILLTFSLALFLGAGKRRGELLNANLTGTTRKSLDGYNLDFINVIITIVSTIVILCYTMYTLDPAIKKNLHPNIVYTVIFVFIAIVRYLQLTFVYNKTESPTKIIYKDLFLQIVILLWVCCIFILKYFVNL